MDATGYRLRPHRDADIEEEVRIWARLHPGYPHTPEQMRHMSQILSTPPLFEFKVAAEEAATARTRGFGLHTTMPDAYDPERLFVGVGVDPEHQRRGVGRSLAHAVLKEARSRGARSVLAAARTDDRRSTEFLARQGFVERRRRWRSRLVVADARPLPDRSAELARDGILISTLAAESARRPGAREKLIEMELVIGEDVPRSGPYTPATMRGFLAELLNGRTLIPEAYFLAVRDGEYLGSSYLERSPATSDELQLGFTGTRREARGRGVATELKRRTVEYARDHGYRSIVTSNDSLNRAMWSINERQGYRREEEWIEAELALR